MTAVITSGASDMTHLQDQRRCQLCLETAANYDMRQLPTMSCNQSPRGARLAAHDSRRTTLLVSNGPLLRERTGMAEDSAWAGSGGTGWLRIGVFVAVVAVVF